MFPLHTLSLMMVGILAVILVLILGALLLIKRVAPQAMETAKKAFGGVALVAILAFGGLIYFGEQSFDKLDALLAKTLPQEGITLIELQDLGTTAIVEKTGCVARYKLKDSEHLGRPGVWPLVPGTGEVIEGCSIDELDRRFIPER